MYLSTAIVYMPGRYVIEYVIFDTYVCMTVTRKRQFLWHTRMRLIVETTEIYGTVSHNHQAPPIWRLLRALIYSRKILWRTVLGIPREI